MAIRKETKKVNDITHKEVGIEPKEPIEKKGAPSFKIRAMDFKIPERGVLWYVCFTVFYSGLAVFSAYRGDWVLLVVALITAIVIIWRSNNEDNILLKINESGIQVNTKSFAYNDLDSFYFSRTGNDPTVSLERVNKFYPRLTFVLTEIGKVEELRTRLQEKLPEKEPRNESYLDFFIRKLKI